jgi:hypothetical protein
VKWKKRQEELQGLKKKYQGQKWKTPFPDLSVESDAPPCSNSFSPIKYSRGPPPDAKKFPVGNNHKQGPELLTPDMVKNYMKYMGGKKT